MQYADALAFVFPQHLLMKPGAVLTIESDIVLDACHVTTAPPFAKDMESIAREHFAFVGALARQNPDRAIDVQYGLQHPPVDATRDNLVELRRLGIRFMTLAYELPTEYGGGFATPDAPLTERGKWLIETMGELGIVLDLSHAGHQTARDVIDVIHERGLDTKIVATHTGCFDVFPHLRNLPDDVLLHITKLGGFIGLVTATWLLSTRDNTLLPFINHLTHLMHFLPWNSICIGTDGIYSKLNQQEATERLENMRGKLDPRGNFKPRCPEEPPPIIGPDKLLVIQRSLEQLDGMTDSFIEDFLGKTLIRYFKNL